MKLHIILTALFISCMSIKGAAYTFIAATTSS